MAFYLQGRVVAYNSAKTCKVRICSIVWHKKFKKVYRKYKNIMTHDGCNEFFQRFLLIKNFLLVEQVEVGDWVRIKHVQRVSRKKHFAIDHILIRKPRDAEIDARNDPAIPGPEFSVTDKAKVKASHDKRNLESLLLGLKN
jgi:ribosomal protein S17